jgi:hypothetical protein
VCADVLWSGVGKMIGRGERRLMLAVVFGLFLLVSMAAVGVTASNGGDSVADSSETLSQNYSNITHTVDVSADDDNAVEINGVEIGQILQQQLAEMDEMQIFIRLESIGISPEIENEGAEAVVDHLQTESAANQAPVLNELKSEEHIEVINKFWITNSILVEIDANQSNDAQTIINKITKIENVERLHANYDLKIPSTGGGLTSSANESQSFESSKILPPSKKEQATTTTQTSSNSNYQWTLEQINVPQVHNQIPTKGQGAAVVVLDTGVDASHPDLDVVGYRDWDEDGNRRFTPPADADGHGTHVSGTVAGSGVTDDDEYYGVAPEADLYVGNITGNVTTGSFTFAAILSGLQWAANDVSADVVTMSFRYGEQFPFIEDPQYESDFIDPIQNSIDSGTVVVASTGNKGDGISFSPGNLFQSIGVGATNQFENIIGSSSGEVVDKCDFFPIGLCGNAPEIWPDEWTTPSVVAPGHAVKSAAPNNGYDVKTGTSMAAPHVAGSVALIKSIDDKDNIDATNMDAILSFSAQTPDSNNPDFEIIDVDFENSLDEGEIHSVSVDIKKNGGPEGAIV